MIKRLLCFLAIGLCIVSLGFGQMVVSADDLAKAEKEGRIMFKAKLTDANFIFDISQPSENRAYVWILKFNNGAITFVFGGFTWGKEYYERHEYNTLWWTGKTYVVLWEKSEDIGRVHCYLLPEESTPKQ